MSLITGVCASHPHRHQSQLLYYYIEVLHTILQYSMHAGAVKKLGSKPEITRFKGLGEISPDEFARFIGPDMRVQPVMIMPDTHVQDILEYYMGKNTPQRQDFIISNLKVELDLVDGKPMANE